MTFGMIPTKKDFKIFIFSGRGECQVAKGPLPLDQGAQTEAGYLARMDHAPVAVILCVPPKYPPSLLDRNAAGHATIRCKVGPEGDVLESTVLNADQPEFGETADAAVRQWLFRPAVMNHRFVETTVDIPLYFHVPKG
jgi:TonB family protein